ncbi:MAG: DUF4124 domain-containing protein [Gammaproteobacteria bacterium]
MKCSLRNYRYLVLLPGLLCAVGALAERTFKWVDEEGNVHYGDRVPLQYTNQEHQEINEQGRTLKTYEAPSTPEEIAERKRFAAIQAEQKKQQAEQAKRDEVLLATYSSEADLLLMRDNRIAAIEELIQLTDSRITSLQKRLADLAEEAAGHESRGRPVPEFVQQQTASVRKQISDNQEIIKTKRAEMAAIQQQFAADIARYQELQGGH